MVLEADAQEPRTLSVGFARLEDDTYSFIAEQKNDTVEERTINSGRPRYRNRYRGAHVMVVRGTIRQILELPHLDENKIHAVRTAEKFHHIFAIAMHPVASRLSFDFLSGYDKKGNTLSGITDITARLGGTCPALLMAAEQFRQDRNLHAIKSEVTLNYDPSSELTPEVGAKRYLDHPSLRITAKVIQRQGSITF